MTNNKPRSISIFLLDGDPDGVRMAQITMSTIQSIAFRRSQFSRVRKEFKEISRPGVYLLLGQDINNPDINLAYIGESEDVASRLQTHITKEQLDFWTDTIVLISKDENLTKSHARYVEALLISRADENKRWKLKNCKKPSEIGKLPKPDQSAMDEFIEQSEMLIGALGWDIFKSVTPQSSSFSNGPESLNSLTTSSPEFTFSGNGFSAKAIISETTGEWVILKGSTARLKVADKISAGASKMRDQLLADAVIIAQEDCLIFDKNYKFNSSSLAAQVICGFAQSGPIAWKLDSGKTYKEWDAEQAELAQATTENNG